MSIEILIPFIVMVIVLLMGVPIAFALAISGIVGILVLIPDFSMVLSSLSLIPFSSVSEYILTTVPMFILMAYFTAEAGLAKDLFTAAAAWTSHLPGGLAIATILACMLFGAMSGSSVACASVMSTIALPNMKRYGYSDILIAGSIGIGSCLVILIPPSIFLIIYGIATETSIGKLLIAGIVPGIILAFFLIVCVSVWVKIKPHHAPKAGAVAWAERLTSLKPIWLTGLLILAILVFLYSGVITPTEVGAVGAFCSLLIGIGTRRLTISKILQALILTVRTTAMIFFILIGANIFNQFMTLSQVPAHLINLVQDMNLSAFYVLLFIAVGYFVISMFMDELPLMLLTLQITFPLIISLGIDPIWFGIFTIMLVSMGLVFPPVGLLAFVISATSKISLTRVYIGTAIMIIAIILTTIVICTFPELVMWLPSTMRG